MILLRMLLPMLLGFTLMWGVLATLHTLELSTGIFSP